MQRRFLALFAAMTLLAPALPAQAGECWSEPYHLATGSATVKSAVFMRSGPCQDGTSVLATASAGASVSVLAEDHEWYLIRLGNGATGWVWHTFLTLGAIDLSDADRATVEAAFPPAGATTTAPAPTTTAPSTTTPSSLLSRVRGHILLQVQQHGEAWYVDPLTSARYYMKDGPTAYEMMRTFGLGVTEANYAKIAAGNAELKSRLKGRIVLRVQLHGEAYYLHPDGSVHYLKDGPAAYEVMRAHSLGITDADLSLLTEKALVLKPAAVSQQPSTPSSSSISLSPSQAGSIPSNIDVLALNAHWLSRINALRAERGLRQLALDQRFVDTATEWAGYMGVNDDLTHARPDGSTMHQWIDAKGLAFTVRNSLPDGWVTNYFTENISWDFADDAQEDAEQALENTLAFYLGEAASNGPHYRTVYHPDWNTVGAGFYFAPGAHGYKMVMAFHYGSLQR